MSALLDELRSVLSHFRGHVAEQVNSGALVDVDRHLATLDSVAHDASKADEAVRGVLGELYGMHPAAPAAPVETVVPAVVEQPAAPVAIESEPVPAAEEHQTVAEPIVADERAPETVAPTAG